MNAHDMAMDYLNEMGIGGEPAPVEVPIYETYFISKSLEDLIASGNDELVKTFDLVGKDGQKFQAVFTIRRI